MSLNGKSFEYLGNLAVADPHGYKLSVAQTEEFKQLFGVNQRVFARIYKMADMKNIPAGKNKRIKPQHLLIGLLFLKSYGSYTYLCRMSGIKSKITIRKYIELTVEAIAGLFHKVIVWENRFKNKVLIKGARSYKEKTCKVTVDGTKYRILEPTPTPAMKKKCGYDKRFSHSKIAKSCLTYELAVCIRTGDIVWANGPFPAGEYNDIKIFKLPGGLRSRLAPGEQVEADKGYPDFERVRMRNQYVSISDKKAKGKALDRHEHINGLLKNWGVLAERFRHSRSFHKVCFKAVCVLTQVTFDCGDRPWDVNY